jgi:DNA polymerase-3 subunit beta
MNEITDDKERLAAIAAAAGGSAATEPGEAGPTEPSGEGVSQEAAAAQPARKRAARKKAAEGAAAQEPEGLYWAGPTALLRRAFSRVAKAAGSKSMPILRCVGIRWDYFGLHVHATNLEVHATHKVLIGDGEVEASGEGGVAVEAAAFGQLLERAAKTVSLRYDGGQSLRVESDGWKALLMVCDITEMPPMPKVDGVGLYMPSRALKRMLRVVYGATSGDAARYVINGVCFEFGTEQSPDEQMWRLNVIATDGRRLAKIETTVQAVGGSWVGRGELLGVWTQQRNVILPNQLVAFLLNALTGNEDSPVGFGVVTVPEPGGQPDKIVGVWFMEEGQQIWGKVIDGAYPNYRQVIPKPTGERVTLDIEAFVDAVDRASLLAGGGSNSVLLEMEDRSLTVVSAEVDRGRWEETVQIIAESSPVERLCKVSVNPDYVPILSGTGQGTMDIGHVRSNGPLVWESLIPITQKCEAEFRYVLMPMRVDEGGAA